MAYILAVALVMISSLVFFFAPRKPEILLAPIRVEELRRNRLQ